MYQMMNHYLIIATSLYEHKNVNSQTLHLLYSTNWELVVTKFHGFSPSIGNPSDLDVSTSGELGHNCPCFEWSHNCLSLCL